jgi:hypothetical protein
MIQFRCGHCGAKLKAADTSAGKTQRCPACKAAVAVPTAKPALDADLFDIVPKRPTPSVTPDPPETSPEPAEHPPEPQDPAANGSRLPWPVDALVYPLRPISLLHLAALWLLLFYACPKIMSIGLGAEYVPFVYSMPIAYAVYYLAECLRDRAGGGRHMPDYWIYPGELNKWGFVTQTFEVLGCVAMCFWPPAVYYVAREQADCIYWLLMAGGAFVFPMLLLSVVLFDSFSGLHPGLIGGAIFRAFVPYSGIVVLLCGISLLIVSMGFRLNSFYPLPRADFLLRLPQLYLLFVAIAILGDFYRRHEDRLGWDI